MTVETKIKVGGDWKVLNGPPQVKVGGDWKTLDTIEIRVGGDWKVAFSAGPSVVQLNITVSQHAAAQTVTSGVRFQQVGCTDEIDKDGNTIDLLPEGQWWSAEPQANIGNDYDVREVSNIAGPWDFFGAAVGVWVNIGTGRNWSVVRVSGKGQEGPGTDNAKGNFEIRDSATQTVRASFTLEASATIDP